MKLGAALRPGTGHGIDTAEMRNEEVIAAGLAAVQQLNIAIVAAAVEMDDDEPYASKRYRDSTFYLFR